MDLILPIIIISITILIFDSIWLRLNLNMYKRNIFNIQKSQLKVRIIPTLVSYIFLITGILYFSVFSSNPLLNGSLFGLLSYGIYNSVNMATLSNYSLQVSLIDTLWGTFLCGFTSYITSYLTS